MATTYTLTSNKHSYVLGSVVLFFAALLFDKFGSQKILFISTLCCGFGTLLFATATHFGWLLKTASSSMYPGFGTILQLHEIKTSISFFAKPTWLTIVISAENLHAIL